jgi:predicted AlkP superfamily phosphohydrolase/phosphomutase
MLVQRGVLHVSPPPRSALRHPPVWELLDRSNVKTAVIRLNFTYPAEGQASIVISNRVVPDMWEALGVKAETGPEVVAPASRRTELFLPFSDHWTPDAAEVPRVLPQLDHPAPADITFNPVHVLQKVLPYDQRTFQAGEQLLRSDPDLEVLMMHFGGFDNVCHAFWQYRFPDQFRSRPDAEDIRVLGPAIDRYAEFLDRGIARLIAAAPSTPNVLIVSDHGHAGSDNVAPWRGWHATPGIFIAAGPDVPHRPGRVNVSYYDVAPTMIDLKGLVPPAAMRGQSIVSRNAHARLAPPAPVR